MSTILIKNGYAVLYKNNKFTAKLKDILIENETIKKIDDNIDYKADIIIDASDKIIFPGLMNMHTHIPMKILQGLGEGESLNNWLINYIFPAEEKLTDHEIYISSKMSILEMLKSGITFFNDMYFRIDKILQAAEEMGVRCIISDGCTNFDKNGILDESIIASKKEKMLEYKDHKLIDIACTVHQACTINLDDYKTVLDRFRDYTDYCDIHLAETESNREKMMKEQNLTPSEFVLNSCLGNYRLIAAHCVHIDETDIENFKKLNVYPVYNPISNAKLASGTAPIVKYIKSGIPVCIGTDGSCSNNNLNLIEEMKFGSLIQKLNNMDSTAAGCDDLLKMATLNAATALGREDELGDISVGKLADLAIFSLDDIEMQPNHNLISNFIYSGTKCNAVHVIINGNIVLKNGKLVSDDEDEIISEFKKTANLSKKKFGL